MRESFIDQILKLLPQTQCTKCGYASCRQYAEAMANEEADINRCSTGGETGIARLAQQLGTHPVNLNPLYGVERPRSTAAIDESACIGCTLCIHACPVDAIIGTSKMTHTVLPELCTGCDLCIPSCPVDCIDMVNVTGNKTGWNAWSQEQANQAQHRYELRALRLAREKKEEQARLDAHSTENKEGEHHSKSGLIRAAIERARAKALLRKR